MRWLGGRSPSFAALHCIVAATCRMQNKVRAVSGSFEMRRSFTLLKHLSLLSLYRTPPFRAMSTSQSSAEPFFNSCEKLDSLIKKLESDLGVKEPFDVKKAMSAQGKPTVAASATAAAAAPQKPAAAVPPAAAGGGGSAQDAPAAKPKKEKADKDKAAAPPKAPPVNKCALLSFNALIPRRPRPSPTLRKLTCALALLFLQVCPPPPPPPPPSTSSIFVLTDTPLRREAPRR
jgi:hypothetical protein